MDEPSPARPPLRVLVVEDSEFDARLLVGLLRSGGYEVAFRRVDTAAAMRLALAEQAWDIVFSDHQMPEFDAAQALRVLQESGHDLPFIIVSGGIGEETAVALMKAGAHDFLMKGQLGRLLQAVDRELRAAKTRAERRETELRYRRLWENSPDAILMMDAEGRIAFVNPAAQQVFGFTPEQMLGRLLSDFLAHEVQGTASRGVDLQALSVGGTHTRAMVEMTGRHAAGHEIIIEAAFTDMELQGRRWHIAFVRDITARRQAEQALQLAEQEFALARQIQQSLFPKAAPQVPGFDIAGASYPAVEAGGDSFDYLPMPEGDLGLVVSDVSGHGMGPALIMAETRAYLRIVAYNRRDAGLVLTRANQVLAEDLEGGAQFVTTLLVRLSPGQRRLAYANAGHTTGYVLNARGDVKVAMDQRGLPLALDAAFTYPESESIPLEKGDLVLLVTDGVEEAEAPDGSVFGSQRVLEVVRTHQAEPAAAIVAALRAAVVAFSQGAPQTDDVTVMIAKVVD